MKLELTVVKRQPHPSNYISVKWLGKEMLTTDSYESNAEIQLVNNS